MNVGSWLGSLGLDQYEDLFREHEIEADILPELTDQHLKDLGVPLGHRLRLLRAIRELAIGTQPDANARPQKNPERRQLTLMFCDLVGSTALTAQRDPEDMADLIRAFQGAVTTAIARFEGHVAKWMGDAAMVFFGYPRAHEDDAERATRAAIALIEAVAQLGREHGATLRVRIGIATGLVVVGEGETQMRGLVGDTPDLATRLQALAEPDTIVVSEATRRLLGKTFKMKELEPRALGGIDAPVAAWLILAERENVSRFEASRSETLTPFVGRDAEIALLVERWQRAAKAEGQVAVLSGEAGIGKSRVLATLRERIGEQSYLPLRYQCSPHHVNDAFHPVIGQIWFAAGFVSGEAAGSRLAKLEKMIESTGLSSADIVPFVGSLLSLPTGGRYPALELAPNELKERMMAALLAMTAGAARQMPLLMIVEDAHWIDPTSLDLTTRMIERMRDLPIMMVITCRPEFTSPWSGDNVTTVTLNRLDRQQAEAMVDRMTAGKKLPPEVLEQILAKTDGVPLFMEELTKSVLESGLVREKSGAYVLASALTPLAIPSTLQDSLTARLDRLSPVKETAQIGAAIGREFSRALLEAISPIKGAALDDALHQLIEAELIHVRGAPPKASYVFKHALVQDTAYGSLLRSRRQRIHAHIAWALKQRLTDEEYAPATIAHHYTEAGLAEQAARSWLSAAELALSQSAPVEAERHASTGLALIPSIEPNGERDGLELALLVARANALVPLKSISAPETFAALMAAKQLVDRGIGTDLQRVSVLYGLCSSSTLMASLEQALDFAHQIIELADLQNNPAYQLVGHRQLGTLQFYAGNLRDALANLQKGSTYRDQRRQKTLSYRFGWDQGLATLSFEVLVRLSLGLLDSAARLSEQVLIEIESHGHAATIASARFCVTVWPQFALRDVETLERDGAELAAYCAEKKVEQIRLLAGLLSACAGAMREPTARRIDFIRRALVALRQSGGNTGNSIMLSNIAEAFLMVGDLAGAEGALQNGFAFVEQSGERYWLADLHRLSGQVALRKHQRDRERAEACFVKAIEVARSQEARLLELRAATDLARLRLRTTSNDDVRGLIEPVLAMIEGGETTRDVRDARALLAELD